MPILAGNLANDEGKMKVTIKALNVLVAACVLFSSHLCAMTAELSTEQQTQLIHMVKQDCGSCHGMTLKGGLGPTLLPNEMNKLSQSTIKNTILFGRPGTAMPPFESILTENEALWISQQLQQGLETHD